ncbi:Uma2 family endonuclease [Streptomyces sp. TS71-3]|uniref:Uma2 family endonuclease n=1 Tax=Streptomyces sp. TS71-3 TaxID=2733862 RepID=UPI001B29CBF2|nr:Uma2 family endonuclease [Streptomyces sp. TS71-3]GHJ39913.1 hypothetical protein Sm713_55220 [Streptomyces sp. TS71-3]
MTVVEIGRISMADMNTQSLDEMFERFEHMPVPEGYKLEIVGGSAFMSPQRDTHWEIILDIIEQLRAKYPRRRLKSDVRIDYPGHLNGFASDVTGLVDGAVKSEEGRWRHQDVEFVAEVISKDTARNDYGPKLAAYAAAEVPVYLIADPYQGRCHVYTQPKDGTYISDLSIAFGADVDLSDTAVGLVLHTADFPRD